MPIEQITCECVDWIQLAQDKIRWQGVVIAVMNFRGPQEA
jgi:hypothetical protein